MKHKLKRQGYKGMRFVTTERMLGTATAARKTLREMKVPHINLQVINFTEFACKEVKPKIMKNVRNKDVFLFFDFNGHPNQDLMNCFLTIDALNLAGAGSITLVLPYIPYLRQDRKDEPRVSISAALVIRFLQHCSRVTRVITIDMHSEQLQAVFTIPTDHLPGSVIFGPWAKNEFAGQFDNLVVVAPDFVQPSERGNSPNKSKARSGSLFSKRSVAPLVSKCCLSSANRSRVKPVSSTTT